MRIWNCAWVLAYWVLSSCAPVPVPCSGAQTCAEGLECLAHRCAPKGSEPVAEEGERRIANVMELAVIAEATNYDGRLPGAISFGAQRTGKLEVLLRFDPVWGATEIRQAFLLLEPAPRARSSPTAVPVDVWCIDEPWSASDLTWLDQPELAHPHARAVASANGSPLRVDVTHLVRHLQERPQRDHGLAIRAAATEGSGVSYATGVAGGRAPRIEVYSR